MTIRNLDNYVAALWDWSCLDGCFTGKISVSDVDGEINRGLQFLRLETKSTGAPIPTGQRITFENLAKTGHHTVFVIWGTRNEPQHIRVIANNNGKVVTREYPNANMNLLQSLVKRWFVWADIHRNASFS